MLLVWNILVTWLHFNIARLGNDIGTGSFMNLEIILIFNSLQKVEVANGRSVPIYFTMFHLSPKLP
jgi:hypothetical protein